MFTYRKNSEYNKTVVVHLPEDLKAEFKDEWLSSKVLSLCIVVSVDHQKLE